MPTETAHKSRSASAPYRDPNLQIIFGVTLMAVLGISSVTPAFPKIGRALHLPSQAVGGLITAFTLPGVALAPLLGVLADRWGRKPILVPSLMLFGLAGGACALARDFQLLLALRFLQGIGAASLGVLNVTLIGDLYEGRARTTAMGYNASVLSVGTAGYPAVGGALATFRWYYPFVPPLLAIPVGLLVLFALQNPEPKEEQHLRIYLRQAWDSVKNPQVLGLLVLTLVTFIFLYGAYLTYLPFLMESTFQASPFVIGLTMSGMSLATALASSQLGRLTELCSEKVLIQVAFGLYALALTAIPFVPNLWMLSIPTLLFGTAQGLNIPSLQTLLADIAPVEHRAVFMSLQGTVLRLGQTLGPPLMGAAFDLWGMGGVFFVGAGLSISMFVFAAIVISTRLV